MRNLYGVYSGEKFGVSDTKTLALSHIKKIGGTVYRLTPAQQRTHEAGFARLRNKYKSPQKARRIAFRKFGTLVARVKKPR